MSIFSKWHQNFYFVWRRCFKKCLGAEVVQKKTPWSGLKTAVGELFCLKCNQASVPSLGADVWVLVARVAHFTEARHEEVITAVVRWCILFYVGKLHKLRREEENETHFYVKLNLRLLRFTVISLLLKSPTLLRVYITLTKHSLMK